MQRVFDIDHCDDKRVEIGFCIASGLPLWSILSYISLLERNYHKTVTIYLVCRVLEKIECRSSVRISPSRFEDYPLDIEQIGLPRSRVFRGLKPFSEPEAWQMLRKIDRPIILVKLEKGYYRSIVADNSSARLKPLHASHKSPGDGIIEGFAREFNDLWHASEREQRARELHEMNIERLKIDNEMARQKLVHEELKTISDYSGYYHKIVNMNIPNKRRSYF